MTTAPTACESFFEKYTEMVRLNQIDEYLSDDYWTKKFIRFISLFIQLTHFMVHLFALIIFGINHSDSAMILFGAGFLSIDFIMSSTITTIIRKSRSAFLHFIAMILCFTPMITKFAFGYYLNASVFPLWNEKKLFNTTIEAMGLYYSLYTGNQYYTFNAVNWEILMFFIYWTLTFFNTTILVKEKTIKMIDAKKEEDDQNP